MIKIILSLGLSFILLPLIGQKIIEIQTLNTNDIQVIKDVPFDQKFILKIPAGQSIEKIDYSLKIDSTKKWHYHLGASGTIFNRLENQPFQILMPPIHPNVEYTLSVKAFSKISFSNNPSFKKDIYDIIRKNFENNENIKQSEIDLLKKEISNKIKEYSKHLEIYNKYGGVYMPDPFDENFKTISDAVIMNSTKINSNLTNINSALNDVNLHLRNDSLPNFNKKLFELPLLKDSLSEYSRQLVLEFVNPGIEPLKSISFESATKIIWKLLINGGNSLQEILTGKLKIQGNGIVPSDKIDIESIFFISSFFQLIKANVINTKKNRPYFERNVFKITFPLVLQDYFNHVTERIKLVSERDLLITKLDALILDKYIVDDVKFNLIPDIKLVPTKDSRYLGFDLGIGFAPFLNSFISFQGVNLYFTPVDQSVPLSNYRSRDIFSKRFSFYFGVAQFLESKDSKSEKGLTSNFFSLGNPTLGIGYRLSNLLRFNLGAMAFKKSNLNTTVSTKKNYLTPLANFSLDIGFKDILNTIASIF